VPLATITSTSPVTASAGTIACSVELLTTLTLGEATPPKDTAAGVAKFAPVMVTRSPPVLVPLTGLMAVTCGIVGDVTAAWLVPMARLSIHRLLSIGLLWKTKTAACTWMRLKDSALPRVAEVWKGMPVTVVEG
jgi:hypothetical protein